MIAAATRTPFESTRRVFVLERADTMSDRVANRLLKTLEEPAPVRAPDPAHRRARRRCCPRWSRAASSCASTRCPPSGSRSCCAADGVERVTRARVRAAGAGQRRRGRAGWPPRRARRCWPTWTRCVASALAGGGRRPVGGAAATRAKERGERARRGGGRAGATKRLEAEPKGRDRTALERQFEDAAKREKRRGEREVLDLGLGLAALTLRDLICLAEGAPEAALDPERAEKLADAAHGRDPRRLREAAERCEEVRLSLELNVTEELALSALSYRLAGAGRLAPPETRRPPARPRCQTTRPGLTARRSPITSHLVVEEQHVDREAHAEGVHRGAAREQQRRARRHRAQAREPEQPRAPREPPRRRSRAPPPPSRGSRSSRAGNHAPYRRRRRRSSPPAGATLRCRCRRSSVGRARLS